MLCGELSNPFQVGRRQAVPKYGDDLSFLTMVANPSLVVVGGNLQRLNRKTKGLSSLSQRLEARGRLTWARKLHQHADQCLAVNNGLSNVQQSRAWDIQRFGELLEEPFTVCAAGFDEMNRHWQISESVSGMDVDGALANINRADLWPFLRVSKPLGEQPKRPRLDKQA